MPYVIAQLSDLHIGGPNAGSGEKFSEAIAEINAMSRQPDLVLITGDLTDEGTDEEWQEFLDRIADLSAPWEAIAGNHDRTISELAGHRSIEAGPLHLILLDTSSDTFGDDDAVWLEAELAAHATHPTIIAIHQPPFETGIWWMDCVGLKGREGFENVVRQHPNVLMVLSGHVHRPIQTNWGGCTLWTCPSTSVTVAVDLDQNHEPAETAEDPMIGLHAYTGQGIVTHLVPVGAPAKRNMIKEVAPEFVKWARNAQSKRNSPFS